MPKRLAMTLAFLALLSSPLFADWQYTEWGMTPEEVSAASDDTVTAIPETEQASRRNNVFTAKLEGTFSSGRFNFHSEFRFDNVSNRLRQVQLRLDDASQCQLLAQSLNTRYGEPDKVQALTVMERIEWRDSDEGNGIVYHVSDDSCSITYLALENSDNERL